MSTLFTTYLNKLNLQCDRVGNVVAEDAKADFQCGNIKKEGHFSQLVFNINKTCIFGGTI